MWQKQEYEMPADVLFARPTNRAIKSGMVYEEDLPKSKKREKFRFLLVKVQLAVVMIIVLLVLLIKTIMPETFFAIQQQYETVMTDVDLLQELPLQQAEEEVAGSTSEGVTAESQPTSVASDTIVVPSAVTEPEAQGSTDVSYEKFVTNPTSETQYTLAVPVISPVETGRITSEFGSRTSPITGMPEFHSGLDIASGEGTKIMTVADGTVIAASYDSISGYYVKIDHGNGFTTSYAHLDSYSVEEGDELTAGETIGVMGTTGSSTGIHLHLSFILDGIRVNPIYAYPDGLFN